ncbi:MAG: zinc-binding protein [Fuerstiella sp.]|nr:zinc-binding protein [Fuerstiella sp.]MCP4855820.1 zinc-binding protein [Fuerstiella sp.]
MTNSRTTELPLAYSCSGCSNIAQLANRVAVELDRDGIAEMSCIAGVGGGVEPLVKKAKSGRRIISLDGCALLCVKRCLAQQEIDPTFEYTLTDFGIKKQAHTDFLDSDVDVVKTRVIADINSN